MSRILQDNGYDEFNNKLIITEKPLVNWLQKEDLNEIPQTTEESNIPTPPIPKPTSPNDLPPTESNKLIVSSNPISNLNINLNGKAFVPSSKFPTRPSFPTNIHLQFSTYWKQVGTAVIVGEQVYIKEISYTNGMSTTKSETLSAEVGVAYGALSAKITATVGHSVTISNETTITDTYNINVSKGTTTVYVLWQLVEEYLFVDSNGQPINWSGNIFPGGLIGLPVTFPNEPKLNQSNTVYSDRTDFKS
ncbi:hypothetical protein [Nonlabens dokdonensis]|nr:hypothetical protein [Nonlabens dokdonensis]